MSGYSTADNSIDALRGTRLAIKARIDGIDTNIIPNPCKPEHTEEDAKIYQGLHRTPISADVFGTGKRPPMVNDKLIFKCYEYF